MKLSIALSVVAATAACTPFSSYQSAKLLPTGKTQVTVAGGVIGVHVSADGESETETDPIGEAMARFGVSEAFELGAKVNRIFTEDDEDLHQLLVDGKFALIPDRLAVAIPVGFAFVSDDVNLFQFHPTLLGRVPLSPNADLELTGKVILVFAQEDDEAIDNSEVLVATTAGLRLGPDLSKWWFQPEMGLITDPGEDGFGFHFGIGFSFVP